MLVRAIVLWAIFAAHSAVANDEDASRASAVTNDEDAPRAEANVSGGVHVRVLTPTPLNASDTLLPSVAYLRFNHECRSGGGAACAFSPSNVYCGYLPGTELFDLTDRTHIPTRLYVVASGSQWLAPAAPDLCRSMNATAEFSGHAVWTCSAVFSTRHNVRVENFSMHCERAVTAASDMARACTVSYDVTHTDALLVEIHATSVAVLLGALVALIYVVGDWALLPVAALFALFAVALTNAALTTLGATWIHADLRATF